MHTPTVEPAMLVAGLVTMIAILATRLSTRLGIPTLLLFLATGMLAGSDGPGGIWFNDPLVMWSVGVLALAVLLFAAGLETPFSAVRPALGPGLTLATVGLATSATLTATFYHSAFDRPFLEGLLLGGIVSSTDAAAVFGVLRASGVRLRGKLPGLLELESGSNDPVAVFVTLASSAALIGAAPAASEVATGLVVQLVVGLGIGVLGGLGLGWSLRQLRVDQDGLYPVFALAFAAAAFGAATLAHGSGFLAVYVTGIVAGSRPLVHREHILRFHDAIAWVAQITMFVLLGLLVFPSHLPSVAPEGLAVAAFGLIVARPVAVFLSLTPFRIPLRDQAMVSWVGLRGAVPIVLATWPRVLGVPGADQVFDIVFFVVLVSVFVQGVSIPWVATRLGVLAPSVEDPAAEPASAAGHDRSTA